jgi:hypothetical protein
MTEETNTLTVRIILPTIVKEITGSRDEVVAEVQRLLSLESDLGRSYAEIIPAPTSASVVVTQRNRA